MIREHKGSEFENRPQRSCKAQAAINPIHRRTKNCSCIDTNPASLMDPNPERVFVRREPVQFFGRIHSRSSRISARLAANGLGCRARKRRKVAAVTARQVPENRVKPPSAASRVSLGNEYTRVRLPKATVINPARNPALLQINT